MVGQVTGGSVGRQRSPRPPLWGVIVAAIGCSRLAPVAQPDVRRLNLAERCSVIDSVLQHKTRPANDPESYRVPLADDECAHAAAAWRGKLLIEANMMPGEQNIFALGETCPAFSPYIVGARAADFPAGVVVVELQAQGTDAFQWFWYVNALDNPSRGTCGPNRGIVKRQAARWVTGDTPAAAP